MSQRNAVEYRAINKEGKVSTSFLTMFLEQKKRRRFLFADEV